MSEESEEEEEEEEKRDNYPSRKLSESASTAYDLGCIFGPVGLHFEGSGPRESPCGTPDGRLGLPRHPESSLGRGGRGFSRILGVPQNHIFDTFPPQMVTYRETSFLVTIRDETAPLLWGGDPSQMLCIAAKINFSALGIRRHF